jgi:hypothetical protein
MIALTSKLTWDFSLKDDKEKTVFKLRALTGVERLAALNQIGAPGNKTELVLRYGLVGWENFRDAQGQVIEFKKDKDGHCDVVNFDYLSDLTMLELRNAIQDRNEIQEEERKN